MAEGLDYLIEDSTKWSNVLNELRNSILSGDNGGLSDRIKKLIELSCKSDGESFNAVFVLNRLLGDRDIKPNSERVIGYLKNEIVKSNENNYGLSLTYHTKQNLTLLTTQATRATAGTESVLNGLYADINPDSLKSQEPITAIDTGSGNGAGAIAIAKLLQCKVIALDINPNYLCVIRFNSLLNHVKEYVIPLHGNVLKPKHEAQIIRHYDVSQRKAYNELALGSSYKYKIILSNTAQRAVLPGASNLDFTKQFASDDDGLKFLQKIFEEAKTIIDKDGIYYLQLLDWHNRRQLTIFQKHNLNWQDIPESVIRMPISKIPDFPIGDFVRYENDRQIRYVFEGANGGKITANDAMEAYNSGGLVYTTFRLYKLSNRLGIF